MYCKEYKLSKDFNKEHIIPRSFGTFKAKEVTLIQAVCEDCNNYFSKELETDLGRDSVYGIMYRSKVGILNHQKFIQERHHKKNLSDSYINHKEHGYLLVDFTDFANPIHPEFQISIASQLRVMNSTKGIKANVRISHKLSKVFLKNIGLCFEPGFIELYLAHENALDEYEKINSLLIPAGIVMPRCHLSQIYMGQQKEELHFYSIIGPSILRGIAKIAFNYFTSQYGKSVVLQECFDCLRNYIRYGANVNYQVVNLVRKKIYYQRQLNGKSREGHVFIISQDQNNNVYVVASLFNSHTYEIVLCQNYPLVIPKTGSFFDIKDKKIYTHKGCWLEKNFVFINSDVKK